MKTMLTRFALAIMLTPLAINFAAAQAIDGPSEGMVYVSVTQNRELTGNIVELDALAVTTSFGDVNVPMAKIDGIKMNATPDGGAVLAFKNGDIVTGKVNLDKVQLKTDWGTAHIDTTKISTITTDKNARFFTDNTSGGSGWKFTKATPVPASNQRMARPGGE